MLIFASKAPEYVMAVAVTPAAVEVAGKFFSSTSPLGGTHCATVFAQAGVQSKMTSTAATQSGMITEIRNFRALNNIVHSSSRKHSGRSHGIRNAYRVIWGRVAKPGTRPWYPRQLVTAAADLGGLQPETSTMWWPEYCARTLRFSS
ncbi:MAG: hypothetical protein J0I07_01040 [Myxococcales bacterium]|nr:hypothetical protein [Myxococcales bacterium]